MSLIEGIIQYPADYSLLFTNITGKNYLANHLCLTFLDDAKISVLMVKCTTQLTFVQYYWLWGIRIELMLSRIVNFDL